ncbi:HAAS signaling domain-containing protein [Aeromicrobium sp. P5_D10]
MSKDTTDEVQRYLDEVDAALAAQGVDDRGDIIAGLHEHIDTATSADGRRLSDVLRELGDPQAIAASAGGPGPTPASGHSEGIRSKPWFSIASLALVFIGAVLAGFIVPIVLVLVGIVLLWLSTRWTAREKLWGTLLVPAPGLVLWIVLGFAGVGQECVTIVSGNDEQTTCTDGSVGPGGVIATILLVGIAIVGVVATIRLARRALDRS